MNYIFDLYLPVIYTSEVSNKSLSRYLMLSISHVDLLAACYTPLKMLTLWMESSQGFSPSSYQSKANSVCTKDAPVLEKRKDTPCSYRPTFVLLQA